MSDLWGYNEKCEGDFCPYDCDKCAKADYSIEEEDNIIKGGDAIAAYLHIGRATLSRHMHEIPHFRLGRVILADRRELDRWMRSKYGQGAKR